MVNGKSKGNRFERVIAKKLSLWVSSNTCETLFWRTTSSGGRHTDRVRKGLSLLHNQSGDITSVDPRSEFFSTMFHIECKNYKSVEYDKILFSSGKIIGWWNTAINDCANAKHPLLIVKENRTPIVLLCDIFTKEHFDDYNIIPLAKFYNPKIIAYNFLELVSHDIWRLEYSRAIYNIQLREKNNEQSV